MSTIGDLVRACKIGDLAAVEKIINDGVVVAGDYNNYNSNNMTPLMWACRWGYTEIVQVLLKSDLARPDYVISHISDSSALIIACRLGHAEIVELLLATNQAHTEYQNMSGWTALMYACDNIRYWNTQNSIHIITALLKSGQAHPELKNRVGDDALAIAQKSGFAEIVKLLLKHLNEQHIVEANVKHAAKKI